MIIQEVVEYIISQLKADISPLLGGATVKGNGLAIQGPDGRVMSIDADKFGERENFTISDNETPRFYIRLLRQITTIRLEGAQRLGSCGGRQKTASCRLVFMAHCKDAQKLLLAIESILYSINFSTAAFQYGAKNVDLLDRAANYIPWEIYNQETLKPKKDFYASSLQLVAVDFDIRVGTNYKSCTDLKLC